MWRYLFVTNPFFPTTDVAVARSWMPLFDSRSHSESILRCPITCINGHEDLAVDMQDGWKVLLVLSCIIASIVKYPDHSISFFSILVIYCCVFFCAAFVVFIRT
jgi:hypothetical protein